MNFLISAACLFHIFASTVLVTSECVPAFSTPENRQYYDVCKDEDCIIFRTGPPFVFLDPQMKHLEDQRPFLCSEYLKQHNGGLDGVVFKFIERIKPLEDAHCVWAGHDCGFDEMLDFMKKSALQGDQHRWIVGSILFALPYRITNYSLPTLPFYEDQLFIIGPPMQGYTSLKEAWVTLLKPFTFNGWCYILLSISMHLFLRITMGCIFTELHASTKSFEWNQVLHRLFDISNTYKRQEERDEIWWRRLNKIWLMIATIFVITSMVFWEVAIAAQVYETRLEAPAENIDPRRFAIIRNSAQLTVFKALVNSTRKVWHEYSTIEEVYEVARMENNNIDYTVNFGVRNRYQMKIKPELCVSLRRYDEFPSQVVATRKPPSISGVWFYSSRIPLSRRIEIDSSIASNKKKGIFQKFIDEYAGETVPDGCDLKSNRIDWVLLGLLHAVIVGLPSIFFAFTIVVMGGYCYYRRMRFGRHGFQGNSDSYMQKMDTMQ